MVGGHGCDIIGKVIGNVTIFEYMGNLNSMRGHGCDIIGKVIGNVTIFEYMGNLNSMRGHGWAQVVVDGCGLGMGPIEVNVGL